jgi:hypothetical protein
MRLAKITLVLIAIAALINWVRAGHDFGHIARCLPFCGGHRPGFCDVGALALLGLAAWGLARLNRPSKEEGPGQSDLQEEADDGERAANGPEEENEHEDGGQPN